MPSLRRPRPAVLAAVLVAAVAAAACEPRLAQRHEFFSPLGGGADDAAAAAETFAVRHRALQEAQHACASPAPGAPTAVVCPRRARFPAAYGASSNAYRRWADDAVRELPPLSATAASAGGG